jgi:hypothetical protein
MMKTRRIVPVSEEGSIPRIMQGLGWELPRWWGDLSVSGK